MANRNICSHQLGLVFILSLLCFISSCVDPNEPVVLRGETMGTSYTVKYFSQNKKLSAKKLHAVIHRKLEAVNKEMSTYVKDSELSKFNQSRKLEWIQISEGFFHVVEHALYLARVTSGIFDPTIGPLVNLWGFGPEGIKKVPSREEIEKARDLVGYWRMALNKEEKKIKKLIPELYLDLSASAKGFGVDSIVTVLQKNGVKNYMVEIGGELRVGGVKPNGPWKVAIEAPDPGKQGKRYQKILELKDLSMATSGDYRNFFEENGKKYSHTIDFRTGKPVEHTLASVTVIDKESGMVADSWATALMALGPDKGLEIAEKMKLAAYFIYRESGQNKKNFIEKGTEAFNRLFPN